MHKNCRRSPIGAEEVRTDDRPRLDTVISHVTFVVLTAVLSFATVYPAQGESLTEGVSVHGPAPGEAVPLAADVKAWLYDCEDIAEDLEEEGETSRQTCCHDSVVLVFADFAAFFFQPRAARVAAPSRALRDRLNC